MRPHGHRTVVPSPRRPDQAAPGRGGRRPSGLSLLPPPCSRLQSLGPPERLAGPAVPRLAGGAEPLQALAPPPRPARKEPPAHCRAWAGTGEANAPTRAAAGAQGAGGPGAERGRAGRCPPRPGRGFGLAEGSTEGHGGDLNPEGGRPSPDCWQIVTYTQSGKQNLAYPKWGAQSAGLPSLPIPPNHAASRQEGGAGPPAFPAGQPSASPLSCS